MTKDEAKKLWNSEFWKDMTYEEIAKFQIIEKKLCMPFNIFHEAVEKTIGRSVFTHELALNYDGIVKEIFEGADPPSFEEIINLIPKDKQIIFAVVTDKKRD